MSHETRHRAEESRMKIGVVGAGNIGGTLGAKWAAAGHEVVLGVRDPQKESAVERVAAMAGDARLGTSAEAIEHGDVVVFAVPGAAVGALVDANAGALEGTVVIDASNNMRGASRHALGHLRETVPSARLFRAFNTLGWENIAEPEFDGIKADLFFCGDEEERATVERLIGDVGLEPIYLGGTGEGDLVEGMTNMWFALSMRRKMGRRIAFKVLGV